MNVARRTPTLASGGTREMAMATPGNVSDTSLRDMANAPASPVNRAIKRSIIPGDVLTMIWFILLGWMAPDSGNVKKKRYYNGSDYSTHT